MNVPDLPPAAFIRKDLFPTDATSPSFPEPLTDVRAVATDSHFHLFSLNRDGDVVLVYTAEIYDVVTGPKEVTVTTAGGDTVTAKINGECGCGTKRLKIAKLFPVQPPLEATATATKK